MPELNARIPCTAETRDALRELVDDGERYEDVLRRMLDECGDGCDASQEA
jgi:hypothetical protein